MADYISSFTGEQIDTLLEKINGIQIQSGTISVSAVNTGGVNTPITFTQSFSGVPNITVTPQCSTTGNPLNVAATVISTSKSNTGFTMRCQSTSADGASFTFNWIAVYTP